jgi:hypothetical protein
MVSTMMMNLAMNKFVYITDESQRTTAIDTSEIVFADGQSVSFKNGTTLGLSKWQFNCLIQLMESA